MSRKMVLIRRIRIIGHAMRVERNLAIRLSDTQIIPPSVVSALRIKLREKTRRLPWV